MLHTRREALDEILDFMSEARDETARRTAARILNRALETVWLAHPWKDYTSPADFQLTLVIGQRSYALPEYFGRLGRGAVRNLSRSGQHLAFFTKEELAEAFPSAGTTLEVAGVPQRYVQAGTVGVHTQPAVTGDALEVLSSSLSDTDVVVALGGDDVNGRYTVTQIALNGTNAVAAGTWSYLDTFGKSYTTSVFDGGAAPSGATDLSTSRGTVTLRKVTGAVEIQSLQPSEAGVELKVITVHPKPVATDVLAIPLIRRPRRLFFDGDVIPADFWPAIFEAACHEIQVKRGRARTAGDLPRPRLLDLIAFDNQEARRVGVRPFR